MAQVPDFATAACRINATKLLKKCRYAKVFFTQYAICPYLVHRGHSSRSEGWLIMDQKTRNFWASFVEKELKKTKNDDEKYSFLLRTEGSIDFMCPSSNHLRLLCALANGVSGSSGFEVKLSFGDASSGGAGRFCA